LISVLSKSRIMKLREMNIKHIHCIPLDSITSFNQFNKLGFENWIRGNKKINANKEQLYLMMKIFHGSYMNCECMRNIKREKKQERKWKRDQWVSEGERWNGWVNDIIEKGKKMEEESKWKRLWNVNVLVLLRLNVLWWRERK
jgi:hypothetical protein